MQLQRCDNCGETTPSTGRLEAGSWINAKGSDKWAKIGFTISRETKPPAHIELREGQAYYAPVYSQLDICSKCLEDVINAIGLARLKISFNVSEQGDYVTLPKEALEALKARSK